VILGTDVVPHCFEKRLRVGYHVTQNRARTGDARGGNSSELEVEALKLHIIAVIAN